VRQYRLVPVAEHPIFPGASTALSITLEQYETLKDIETVFATVVKNDKILMSGGDDIMAQIEQAASKHHYTGLPQIKSIDDIYSIGSICEARLIEDK